MEPYREVILNAWSEPSNHGYCSEIKKKGKQERNTSSSNNLGVRLTETP